MTSLNQIRLKAFRGAHHDYDDNLGVDINRRMHERNQEYIKKEERIERKYRQEANYQYRIEKNLEEERVAEEATARARNMRLLNLL
jgi:cell division protein FtsL